MDTKAGIRVVRGPDWACEDQDGGEGTVGTVVEILEDEEPDGSGSSLRKSVMVYWDSGGCTNYRVGLNGKYDLRLFDNAQLGVHHSTVTCDGCQETPLLGLRWKCAICYDYDLCTKCYMSGKHQLEHRFLRYDHPSAERVPIKERSTSDCVMAKGLFEGAKVRRGKDWAWGDQDGGEGHCGILRKIRGWETESYRSVVEVEWENSDSKNIYRIGHKGRVDLKYVEAAEWGTYYFEHLPVLGTTPGPPPGTSEHAIIASGDVVKVILDLEVFKAMQEGHGGWNDKMVECLDKRGTVHSVLESGDIRVNCAGRAWTMNPACLVRVNEGHREVHRPFTSELPVNEGEAPKPVDTADKETVPSSTGGSGQEEQISELDSQLGFHLFSKGDVIRVIEDIALCHELQQNHGEWNDDMALCLGQLGRVVNVFDSGDARVKVNGYTWTYNPKCLTLAPGETPPDVPDEELQSDLTMQLLGMLDHPMALVAAAAMGDVDRVKQALTKRPESVDEKIQDKTALHLACARGNLELAKVLLEHNANVNVQDEDGNRPLHVCAIKNEPEIADLLVACHANPNLLNHNGHTPLLIACGKSYPSVVRSLLKVEDIDLSIQDGDGDTALHEACMKRSLPSVKALLDRGADPSIQNNNSFNCLHMAAKTGMLAAFDQMLQSYPHLLNVKKGDGYSSLHLASLNGFSPLVQLLLEQPKCDIDAVTQEGATALHLAVSNGHASIVELLVGHGIDLNMIDKNGCTALHLILGRDTVVGVQDSATQLTQIMKDISPTVPDPMLGSAAMACLLVREGADFRRMGNDHHVTMSPIELCTESVPPELLTKYSDEKSSFWNSLRKHPKPTPQDFLEEEPPKKPQTDTESSGTAVTMATPAKFSGTDIVKSVSSKSDTVRKQTLSSPPPVKASVSMPVTTVMPEVVEETCILCDEDINVVILPCQHAVLCEVHAKGARKCPQCKETVESVQAIFNRKVELCLLCDKTVTVLLKPCDHIVLCKEHGKTAKKCPMCREKITALKQLCVGCLRVEGTVTLKPCDHMTCQDCAINMKKCLECRVTIETKKGLESDTSRGAPSTENNGCPVCMFRQKNTAFMCGHQLCYECSLKVDTCPICTQAITHRIKLYA